MDAHGGGTGNAPNGSFVPSCTPRQSATPRDGKVAKAHVENTYIKQQKPNCCILSSPVLPAATALPSRATHTASRSCSPMLPHATAMLDLLLRVSTLLLRTPVPLPAPCALPQAVPCKNPDRAALATSVEVVLPEAVTGVTYMGVRQSLVSCNLVCE